MIPIQTQLPKKTIEEIDGMVNTGKFTTRSEVVRYLIQISLKYRENKDKNADL